MPRYRGRHKNSFIGLFLDMDTGQASLRRCDMERKRRDARRLIPLITRLVLVIHHDESPKLPWLPVANNGRWITRINLVMTKEMKAYFIWFLENILKANYYRWKLVPLLIFHPYQIHGLHLHELHKKCDYLDFLLMNYLCSLRNFREHV